MQKTVLRPAVVAGLVLFGASVPGAYTQPTRQLVLDRVLTDVPADAVSLPLYLTRQGWYFAQLYLEPGTRGHGQSAAAAPGASRIAFTMTIMRRDRVLRSEAFDVSLAPGATGEMLFRVKTPWDLPQKQNLTVVLQFDPTRTTIDPGYGGIRLQIRKEPGRTMLKP